MIFSCSTSQTKKKRANILNIAAVSVRAIEVEICNHKFRRMRIKLSMFYCHTLAFTLIVIKTHVRERVSCWALLGQHQFLPYVIPFWELSSRHIFFSIFILSPIGNASLHVDSGELVVVDIKSSSSRGNRKSIGYVTRIESTREHLSSHSLKQDSFLLINWKFLWPNYVKRTERERRYTIKKRSFNSWEKTPEHFPCYWITLEKLHKKTKLGRIAWGDKLENFLLSHRYSTEVSWGAWGRHETE